MGNSLSTANLLRVYYTQPVTCACGCCGAVLRMGVVDLDRQRPLCQACVPASVQAAVALRAAGLGPPGNARIELNP